MGLTFLLALIGMPVLEIAVLIEAGEAFGLWPTIGGIILTGVIGAFLFRTQGLRIMQELQATLAAGQTPITALLDGAGLLIAGTLLFLPGFVTDAIGLVLFVPAVRVLLAALLVQRILNRQRQRAGAAEGRHTPTSTASIIDGEFIEIDKASNDDKKPS
jgi:UPF0716 protein FxsA